MSYFTKSLFGAALASLISLSAVSPSFAQDDEQNFQLELNAAAQTTAGSCRLTYVAFNQSKIALDRTAYEVAVFDAEGSVTRLLVLEFGKLIPGKTKILQFDLADTPCASISRILINDVAACTQTSDGNEIDFCLTGLSTRSRTAIQFGL